MNLARLRRRAAWGYWAEALVRAAGPGCGILAAYLIIALFGFANPWAFSGILLLAGLAFGFGASRLRRPANGEIDRRIERASGLRHRPLAMLDDEPENDSEFTAAIWQLHQRRLRASLQNATPGRPFIDAVTRDPLALRGLLLLLLLAGVIIAGPQAMPRLAGAFSFPEWPFAGASINAWVTPPSYTGAPPLVLQPGQTLPVLAGSSLTVVVNGKTNAPTAIIGAKTLKFSAQAEDSFRAETLLTATAHLRVGPWWHSLASWNFQVSLPDGPTISLGKSFAFVPQLRFTWRASDRYGLDSLKAVLAPIGHPDAAAEIMPLSIASLDPRNAGGIAKLDTGDSPFAGLPVSLVLTARNLAGIARSTSAVTLTLPPPNLHDKTALALAGLRQNLALAPSEVRAAGQALAILALHPLSRIPASADVQMAALAQALLTSQINAADAQSLLESLAHQIELGPDYQPSLALAAASRALEQALQQAGSSGKPLDPSRLQSLLATMQSALAQHLQALGPKNAGDPGADAAAMNSGDLNNLAEQIAKDQAAGQTAKAQAELHRLEQILAALQSAKPMSAADVARNATANQAAQDLARLTKAESSLLDQTSQGTAAPGTQAGLRNQLSITRKKLGKAGIVLPGLDDAATAMGTAQEALGGQNETTAAAAENSAIEGLQKASTALAVNQSPQFDAGGQSGIGTDSLDNGTSGAPDETPIPAVLPSSGNAAGAIQQQIIKNDSDPSLPNATHQYYHRLLNPDGP